MKSALDFLLAARQCEIAELKQLARTCERVGVIARFIHAMQRERGLSNLYLGPRGAQFQRERDQQVQECRAVEAALRRHLDELATEPYHARNGARLFNRVAALLHGLDGLATLRARIDGQALDAPEATSAFSGLVADLLGVVFEAADTATDPKVSRALVAMFHFMQGKEFAGQERALGARVFAAGAIDDDGRQLWRHLVEWQAGCFQVYTDCVEPEVLAADRAARDPLVRSEVERLRQAGCASGELDPGLSFAWYAWCTRRIDEMKAVEDLLASSLRELCARRIAQVQVELQEGPPALEPPAPSPSSAIASMAAAFGPHLERSLSVLVQEQACRLQAMGDELDAARIALDERKVIERAKGLLMAHRHMGEDEAYRTLRQMAMNQKRRLVEVAGAVLALAEVLPARR